MEITIKQLIIDYFLDHPNEDLNHGPVVDHVTKKWLELHEGVSPPRDIWRSIRWLHQTGFLVKVKKGVYRYDPDLEEHRALPDFTPEQKEEIFKNDDYKCVECGRRRIDGFELHADHIKPRDRGGTSDISNGQTLCSIHNIRKKNIDQTQTGKRMFMKLYVLAKEKEDTELLEFLREVLQVYEKHKINDHIAWKP